jgi:gamma-glutamyltranspeptidase/glutathione hydrolase
MTEDLEFLRRFPVTRDYFLKSGGIPYKAGDTFVQKDLARTLKLIAR